MIVASSGQIAPILATIMKARPPQPTVASRSAA